MKTTRTIAWTALASLLVIGPLTMTSAHDFPWPGPFSGNLLNDSALSGEAGSFLSVDLRASGLSAGALSEAIGTSDVRNGGFVVKRVTGISQYLVATTPGSAYAALIQADPHGQLHLVAHMHRERTIQEGTRVIILVLEPERPDVLLTVPGVEDGLDAQAAMDAADAGAILLAGGMKF